MKTCFKCGGVKPLSDFYPHKRMADGHLNKCIQCTRRDTADRHAKKSATDLEWVLKERQRHRDKQERYRKAGLAAPATNEIKERWAINNQHKIKAQRMVKAAIKSGRLARGEKCQECGKLGYNEGHHDDYSKPLQVRWLCLKCHGKTRHKPLPQMAPAEFKF